MQRRCRKSISCLALFEVIGETPVHPPSAQFTPTPTGICAASPTSFWTKTTTVPTLRLICTQAPARPRARWNYWFFWGANPLEDITIQKHSEATFEEARSLLRQPPFSQVVQSTNPQGSEEIAGSMVCFCLSIILILSFAFLKSLLNVRPGYADP